MDDLPNILMPSSIGAVIGYSMLLETCHMIGKASPHSLMSALIVGALVLCLLWLLTKLKVSAWETAPIVAIILGCMVPFLSNLHVFFI